MKDIKSPRYNIFLMWSDVWGFRALGRKGLRNPQWWQGKCAPGQLSVNANLTNLTQTYITPSCL
jgi:hypothetical protein